MKFLSLLLLIVVVDCSVAQAPKVQAVAYSRSTTSGIPTSLGGPANNPLPVRYYIYVTVKKGTPVSLSSVCVKWQSYAANLKKVTSPVVVPHDPKYLPRRRTVILRPRTRFISRGGEGWRSEVRGDNTVCAREDNRGADCYRGTVSYFSGASQHPLSVSSRPDLLAAVDNLQPIHDHIR